MPAMQEEEEEEERGRGTEGRRGEIYSEAARQRHSRRKDEGRQDEEEV